MEKKIVEGYTRKDWKLKWVKHSFDNSVFLSVPILFKKKSYLPPLSSGWKSTDIPTTYSTKVRITIEEIKE